MAQFDDWAITYDQDTAVQTGRFPFAGYAEVLTAIWHEAGAAPGMPVLDLGVGTGNLATLFVEEGCQVVGADFSGEMLARAKAKVPELQLVQVDLTADEWPTVLNQRFERIVSNYLFHEFPFETKLRILTRLARNNLAPLGRIIIGDISFPTRHALEKTRLERADEWEEEFYWTAVETREALEPMGWRVAYRQISFCAGFYTFTPPTNLP